MRFLALFTLLVGLTTPAQAQTHPVVPDSLTPAKFTADWIMHPTAPKHEHAVVLFRRAMTLAQQPQRFVVHVTADNQYRLFVNGRVVGRGPARGDLGHWFYETYDLAPYLTTGRNVLAAEVVNFGSKRAFSIFSHLTAFWMQGHGEAERAVDTKAGQWLTYHNEGVMGRPVNWIFNKNDIAFGLYVGNPTDSVSAGRYPWGWQTPDFNDANWTKAAWNDAAGLRGTNYAGGINYSGGWLLTPRRTPLQVETPERLGAEADGATAERAFLRGQNTVIPAHQTTTLLIDNRVLTIGFPELTASGGAGSQIQVTYAECLFNPDGKTKGNRNVLTGKKVVGIKDFFRPDGGANRQFRPTWFRAFRFVELQITTGAEPLTIHDLHNQRLTAPLQRRAEFVTDDPKLNRLVEPGWRTAQIGAQDFLMSDAYYELMQYVGDSRVHSLALLTLAGDDRLTRNALMQFDESRIPDGLTFACAPNAFHLVMPMYSLVWVDQVYDYLRWKDDKAFLAGLVPGMRAVLNWYGDRLQTNGLVGPINWWPASAWPKGYQNGEPPAVRDGNNLLHSLHYAYTLNHAAEVFDFLGHSDEAATYRARANRINQAARTLCYDPARGFFGENPEKKQFSQVTNVVAVLSGAVEGPAAKTLLMKALADTSMFGLADLFWHLYTFEALNKVGLGREFLNQLGPWHTMMDYGLTTYVEVPIEWGEANQRSDCHPWSTSPNVYFYKTICGINPTAPGHRAVRIAPELGHLTTLRATYPHPLGTIELDLKRTGDKLSGTVVVPAGMQTTFRWRGITKPLKPGKNALAL